MIFWRNLVGKIFKHLRFHGAAEIILAPDGMDARLRGARFAL